MYVKKRQKLKRDGGGNQSRLEKYLQQTQRRLISLCKRVIKKTQSSLPAVDRWAEGISHRFSEKKGDQFTNGGWGGRSACSNQRNVTETAPRGPPSHPSAPPSPGTAVWGADPVVRPHGGPSQKATWQGRQKPSERSDSLTH